jgi:hypothetical protein
MSILPEDNQGMKVETFDLIQQRQAETAEQPYNDAFPAELDGPHTLGDGTLHDEPLQTWSNKLFRLLNPMTSGYPIKLPTEAEWYNAMYTDYDAMVELTGRSEQKLAAFVLRNKPFDMGAFVYTKLVVSETGEPDDSLVSAHPLLAIWGRPSGAWVAESPLLRDEASPSAWQAVISEVFDEIGNPQT